MPSRPWHWRVLRWPQALRWRIVLSTFCALVVALSLSAVVLMGLFRDHTLRQFQLQLQTQLDQLTAMVEFDAQGHPVLKGPLSDPRWQLPYSGLYWQIDQGNPGSALRSRSLWDVALALPSDLLDDGEVHVHQVPGPQGQRLLLLERGVHLAPTDADGASPATPLWRLSVAQDLSEWREAQERFNTTLWLCMGVLGGALMAAAWFQVSLGLAPLRRMQRALQDVHDGRAQRLTGEQPTELQPLVADFNAVLDQNEQVVTRARQQAGNLAHAVKTRLSVLANAAADTQVDRAALAHLVAEQTQAAREQVDWHMSRARVAGAGLPGLRTPLRPVVDGLVRVMRKVHVDRGLLLDAHAVRDGLQFAGEAQDLQEILGNLLDNACKWARSSVHVAADVEAGGLVVTVDDDGPGLAAPQRAAVFERGIRTDERVPGAGLGLAIAREVVQLYQGQIALEDSPLGGLRVRVQLPRA